MTTAAEVHRTISETAADKANVLARERGLVSPDASPFFDSSYRIKGRSISIAYDQAFLLDRDDAWKDAMRSLALEAAQAACVTHADLLMGAVIGVARGGRNYFHDYGTSTPTPTYSRPRRGRSPGYYGDMTPLF